MIADSVRAARRLATSAGLFRIVKDPQAFARQLSLIRPRRTRTLAISGKESCQEPIAVMWQKQFEKASDNKHIHINDAIATLKKK
jgi:hypothetical protein